MRKSIVIVGRNLLPGGAERVIVQLANYFSSKDIETTIITMDTFDIFFEVDPKVSIINVAKEDKRHKLKDKLYRYSKLRRIVKNISPNVVLSMPEDVGIYVLCCMLGTGIPVYVSERNNPWVMPDVKITRLLRRLVYPFASGIIFQTKMAKSYFSRSIQNKGVVIPNPVDLKRIPEQFCGDRKNTVVGVGRLAPQKNFDLLIDAFCEFHKDYPEFNLVIYGEGDAREHLEKKVKDLEISDSVDLPGSDIDVLKKINNCAMFVLSSDYEGSPNVLIEAMCMGMPVIATDCPSGGPRELIRDHINGLLIPVGDKNAMVAAMNECVEIENQKRMAANALKIKKKFVGKEIFEDWYKFLFREI